MGLYRCLALKFIWCLLLRIIIYFYIYLDFSPIPPTLYYTIYLYVYFYILFLLPCLSFQYILWPLQSWNHIFTCYFVYSDPMLHFLESFTSSSRWIAEKAKIHSIWFALFEKDNQNSDHASSATPPVRRWNPFNFVYFKCCWCVVVVVVANVGRSSGPSPWFALVNLSSAIDIWRCWQCDVEKYTLKLKSECWS